MTSNSKFKKYKIVFTISNGDFVSKETVEIEATTEESACTGAFRTKLSPKYRNLGCKFFVDTVEIID